MFSSSNTASFYESNWLPGKQMMFDFDPCLNSTCSRSFFSGLLVGGVVCFGGYYVIGKHRKNEEVQNNARNLGSGKEDRSKSVKEVDLAKGPDEDHEKSCCGMEMVEFVQANCSCDVFNDNGNAMTCNSKKCYYTACLPKDQPVFVIRLPTKDASTQCDFDFDTDATWTSTVDPGKKDFKKGQRSSDDDALRTRKQSAVAMPNEKISHLFNAGSQIFERLNRASSNATANGLAETDSIRKLDVAITEVNSMLQQLGNMLEQTRVEFSSRRASIVGQEYPVPMMSMVEGQPSSAGKEADTKKKADS
eukprot:gene2979-3434_t